MDVPFLRKNDISWSDDTSSAWQQMFGHTDFRVTEVYVVLKDGSGLLSRLPGDYEDLPNGSFTLGNKGDMVLYVTHRSPKDSDDWVECQSVIDDSWGRWQPGSLQIRLPELISEESVQAVC